MEKVQLFILKEIFLNHELLSEQFFNCQGYCYLIISLNFLNSLNELNVPST